MSVLIEFTEDQERAFGLKGLEGEELQNRVKALLIPERKSLELLRQRIETTEAELNAMRVDFDEIAEVIWKLEALEE